MKPITTQRQSQNVVDQTKPPSVVEDLINRVILGATLTKNDLGLNTYPEQDPFAGAVQAAARKPVRFEDIWPFSGTAAADVSRKQNVSDFRGPDRTRPWSSVYKPGPVQRAPADGLGWATHLSKLLTGE